MVDSKKVLMDLQVMVGTDLMKAVYYLKKGVAVAIADDNDAKADELAEFYVELNDFTERFQKSYRKIVD